MTRLTSSDIQEISTTLSDYNTKLVDNTGQTMLGICCHASGANEAIVSGAIASMTVCVVPVTTGEGIILGFSDSVASILRYLGFTAVVTDFPDVRGLNQAFEMSADAVFMADDFTYSAFNLKTGVKSDNGSATGRVFAAALDLMAGSTTNRQALIMGCGPVGSAGAVTLLRYGFELTLFDTNTHTASVLNKVLSEEKPDANITISSNLDLSIRNNRYILEATPTPNTIADSLIKNKAIAAPGVPAGVSRTAILSPKHRIIHDTLELGTAAMAVEITMQPRNQR